MPVKCICLCVQLQQLNNQLTISKKHRGGIDNYANKFIVILPSLSIPIFKFLTFL